MFGFGLVFFAIASPFYDLRQHTGFLSDLYISGSTISTLGPTDAGPLYVTSRWLMVLEAGIGFGFLAIVMGYFPVLYAAFSRREVSISLLDARAGSPPTAAELLRRHVHPDAAEALSILFVEWERWSAELLESHISFPLLCYFRSQHNNQSWLSALTSMLDASALLIAGVQGHEARQAQLTFAMARHALVDLSQVFNLKPLGNVPDRLPPERYNQLYGLLCQGGVSMCRDGASESRLREMRRLYEPWAEALSAHFVMPLPPWTATEPHRDNWLAVDRLRQSAEIANPPSEPLIHGEGISHPAPPQLDDHHEF